MVGLSGGENGVDDEEWLGTFRRADERASVGVWVVGMCVLVF